MQYINIISLYCTRSAFTSATHTHCHLMSEVLTQYVCVSHRRMKGGSMLKTS
jgi:hypothetical protein